MRSTLSGAPSLGINESQSRTWENLVGRSRPFWTFWYEPLQETFPDQLGDVDLDAFVRAINRAEPGLIRVDADETTYSLHIILRFELEQELIAGTVALEDLPEIWNARMKEFLGVDVPSNTDGVLQDVHWSGGGIGYFPTYALGNVISLQIWAKVQEALPDLDDQMAARRPARALQLAPRQPLRLGPQADAEGDARPPHRLGRDRPAAVSRLPRRQDGPARSLSCATSASTSGSRSARPRRPRARRPAAPRARSRGAPVTVIAGTARSTSPRETHACYSSRAPTAHADRPEVDEQATWPNTTVAGASSPGLPWGFELTTSSARSPRRADHELAVTCLSCALATLEPDIALDVFVTPTCPTAHRRVHAYRARSPLPASRLQRRGHGVRRRRRPPRRRLVPQPSSTAGSPGSAPSPSPPSSNGSSSRPTSL